MTRNAPAAIKAEWTEALKRSDFAGMLNYYRANYPSLPAAGAGAASPSPAAPPLPPIKAPTLVIHGVKDQALLAEGHDGSWRHIQGDSTLMMIPSAGHDVQHDAGPLVNRTIRAWLDARR
jgi:pimeloyl-ACP methyl ester carboxylesterase